MSQDLITERIGEALKELLGKGWKAPIFASVIAVNGSMIGCEYNYGGDQGNVNCKVLTEYHHPSNVFTLPVNVMFMDSTGRAARMTITEQPEEKIIFD